MMEIKHYGKVRGGGNDYARLHLHIIPSQELTKEEYCAIFETWDEEFTLQGFPWVGWWYKINTRREFALLPAIIRKAQKIGYDLAVSMWDEGIEGKVLLSENPALFWQVIALAQMFYKEE